MNVLDFPRYCFDFRTLARNRALSLTLPPGSRVRAHAGTVWLTQEGLVEDVMLAPGEKFEVKRRSCHASSRVLPTLHAPAQV